MTCVLSNPVSPKLQSGAQPELISDVVSTWQLLPWAQSHVNEIMCYEYRNNKLDAGYPESIEDS